MSIIPAGVVVLVLFSAASAPAAQRPADPSAATPAGSSVPTDYVIGPEDVLGIVFWREPEVSGDVTVRPDGQITIPVIGDLQAAGMRPDQLRDAVVAAARKYITDPNVAVVVRTINSRKFFVTGRVTTPGGRDLRGPLTVLQAIAMAGGLTEYADAKNITILRVRDGKTQSFKFNYKDVSKGKNLEQNISLMPGDTVVVP